MPRTDATSLAEAIAAEMEQFQGTWRQIAYERDGLSEPDDEKGWEPSVTFTGHAFVVTLADGTVPIAGTFALDPTRTPSPEELIFLARLFYRKPAGNNSFGRVA